VDKEQTVEARRLRGLVAQIAATIQVTGDSHGHREFRNRPFGHRELAPGPTRSTQDEREEGEGQEYDDHEAAAIGPAAIDPALPPL
jgi:hypothetical protein